MIAMAFQAEDAADQLGAFPKQQMVSVPDVL